MKTCTKCGENKSLDEFYTNKTNPDGRRSKCKQCHNKERSIHRRSKKEREKKRSEKLKAKRQWRKDNLDWELWYKAKQRSEKNNLPFDIERSDIQIPDKCPVLGIDLFITPQHVGDHSPTVDRIVPSKGYIKGNIAIMSAKANRIKSDGTIEDIEKLYLWLKENDDK
jgi:hypothetical protein